MTKFVVHYTIDGNKFSASIDAETPDEARSTLRAVRAGAIVGKVKVDRNNRLLTKSGEVKRATRAELSGLAERFKISSH